MPLGRASTAANGDTSPGLPRKSTRFTLLSYCYIVILFIAGGGISYSQFYYSDYNSTTGPFSLHGTARYYSTQTGDDATYWWLRLLNNADNELGYAVYNRNLPTSRGITVEFDFKMWAPTGHPNANQSGIGMSVFFIDPSQGQLQTITAKGDGLGFTDQYSGSAYAGFGARPTYLGVSISRAALFASNMGASGDRSGTGGLSVAPPDNALSLRTGSVGDQNDPNKYTFLTNSTAQMGVGAYMNIAPASANRPADASYFRRFRIELVPKGNGMRVTVYVKTTVAGAFQQSFTYDYSDQNAGVPAGAYMPRPDNLGIGFSATSGTGNAKSILEVRNIVVRTPGTVWVQKTTPDIIAGDMPVTTLISNNGPALTNLTVKDTMPGGYKITAPPAITGGTITAAPVSTLTPDGRTAYEYRITANAYSKVAVAWHGKFQTIPSAALLKMSAAITLSGGSDDNTDDNWHTTDNILIPVSHKESDLPYNSAQTVEVLAGGSPVQILWEYSMNSGSSWTAAGTGASFSTSGIPSTGACYLRCTATWSNGDTKRISWRSVPLPDNVITDPNICVQTPVPMQFDIREIAASEGGGKVSPFSTPIVGDIDNDGETEVIVFNCNTSSNWYPYDSILIYGYNQQTAKLYYKYGIKPANGSSIIIDRIATAKVDGSDYASIFYTAPNGTMVKYVFSDSLNSNITYPSKTSWTIKWTTPNLYNGNAWHAGVAPYVTDFNGNGRTQVVYNDKIVDTYTGNILVNGNMVPLSGGYDLTHTFGRFGHKMEDGSFQSTPVVEDIDNDGVKDIVSGNIIYGVTLVDFNNASPGNKFFIKKQAIAPAGRYEIGEGGVAVMDLDLDGQLEVVVVGVVEKEGVSKFNNFCCGVEGMLYVWDPRTGEVLNTNQIARGSGINRQSYNNGPSRPFGGDVDGDGIPEIVFTSAYKLHCFRYDTATHELVRKWPDLATNDRSASTTITMFDFAHDGKQRLVYRDETDMRIIDASGASPVSTNFPGSYSWTGNEYPVVADINGDGAAEIIVCSSKNNSNWNQGHVIVYASSGQPWATARKVWNQSSYNALNVNDDLTIPSNPMSPAHAFHSVSATTGNDTILRPFNGFLMQQGTLRADGTKVWITPDAAAGTYTVTYGTNDITIALNINNNGSEALVSPVYVSAYKNSVAAGNHLKTEQLNQTIYAGETKPLSVTVNTAGLAITDQIVFRINDRGQAAFVQLECNYGNNTVVVRRILGADDTQTVQAWHPVTIDVLANDGFNPAALTSISLLDSIIMPPRNGKLVSTGSGAGSKLVYINEGTGNLSPNMPVDSFQYRIWPAGIATVLSPKVYIYILQDEGGSNNCPGRDYTAKLKALPATPAPPTTFDWYPSPPPATALITASATYTIPSASFAGGWWTAWVQPINAGSPNAGWNLAGGFPAGEFNVHSSSANEQMKWTGHADNNWHNPANWVLIRDKVEVPVSFVPGLCTDVTIPSNVNHFPELGKDTARCNNIRMLDRAMLKNPNVLKYTGASVELKLKPAERDRFLMWSAPLKAMYSGDYHYRKDNAPYWGDVFMNFYQQLPPGISGGVEHHRFTYTFQNTNVPLPLGQSFNLKVVSTGQTKDSVLRFPRNELVYQGNSLTRTGQGRFITDDYKTDTFTMPVIGSSGQNQFVQVVNPYMAYLDVTKLLNNPGNKAKLRSGYYIWDGEVGTGVTTHAFANVDYNSTYFRIIANANPALLSTSPQYIAPLQSFFVGTLANYYNKLTELEMSPHWTTTSPVGSYNLRASVKSGGILNIELSGANRQAHAAIVYEPEASDFSTDGMDMPPITYTIDDQSPLSLYTFSTDMQPLAINASSTFDIAPVTMGLIVKDPGEYTLKFNGLSNCGYEVALTDVALNKRIELSQSVDEYRFTLAKVSGANVIEVNNRFKLYFKYTGKGIVSPTEAVPLPAPVQVTPGKGYISVTSSLPISMLQVFDAYGRTVYSAANAAAGNIRIPVNSGQVYMVRADTGIEATVMKVLVK